MSNKYRLIIASIGVLLALFMIWYFFSILVYIIIAAVISLIGHPIVELLSRLKYKKLQLPKWFSAFITLVFLIGLIVGLILIFVPLIARQAAIISEIDVNEVVNYFAASLQKMQDFLISNGILQADKTLESVLEKQIQSLINAVSFSNVIEHLLTATGKFFIGAFTVLFLSFFFLRDRQLLKKGILILTPDRMQHQVETVLSKTKAMLSRYFIGLAVELLSVMTLITIGLSIFGIENALLIGFLGGLFKIIPYLGPIIGTTIGVVLGVSSALSIHQYDQLLNIALYVVGVFAVANTLDDFVLQPLIFSKSVNAHPIEILLVILMAGILGGIIGMMLAIPGYTVLRIIAKEFLSGFKLIDRLTENI